MHAMIRIQGEIHPLLWRLATFGLTHQLCISNQAEVAQRRGAWETEDESLRHIARAYGVSHEAGRRVLWAARRHQVGRVSTDQPHSQYNTPDLHGQARDGAGPSCVADSYGAPEVYYSMSLDGLITGPNPRPEQPLGEGGERLHAWV